MNSSSATTVSSSPSSEKALVAVGQRRPTLETGAVDGNRLDVVGPVVGSFEQCTDDAPAGEPEVVAVVGLLDEPLVESLQVVVEPAAVADADPLSQLAERERVVGVPERLDDGEPSVVAEQRERFDGTSGFRGVNHARADTTGRLRPVAVFGYLSGSTSVTYS